MRKILTVVLLMMPLMLFAQAKKVYDETLNPMEQIDNATEKAKAEGKHVICQVGGNWCPWCLRLAQFVVERENVKGLIDDNYVYIHVNYPRRGAATELMNRLGNPGRFGYPVLVVLDADGKVMHIQDSSFLEEGNGYDEQKVLRFLRNWTNAAVK